MVLVKQLTWAELQMSQSLQAAEPSAIGRMAAATVVAADELQRKSGSLTALAIRLRQPGSWLSPAATVFINAAREQARGVMTIAEFMHQVGQALQALAAELGSAKAEATAAVAQSRRLDIDVSELNLRVISHVVLPPGPDTPPGAEAEAVRITDGQSSATAALWGAEHRALDAWKRAGAAFDFVRAATPAMRKQWAAPNWDPAEHISLSKTTFLGCTSLTLFGAPEGGFITGPDNRKYPLVLETGIDVKGQAIISGRDVTANNRGWYVQAIRHGYTKYGPEASDWDKAAIIAAGFAGAPLPEGSAFDKAKLKDIHLARDGDEWLEDPENVEGASVKEVTGGPARTAQAEVWVAREDGIASGKKAATPDGIGLLDNGLAGIAMALTLNDSMAARYRVVFEENGAGDLRARLTLYRVTNTPGGPERVRVEAGVADKNGHLAGIPVTGHDRNLPTEMKPAG
jgi:hypothetical protein